MRTQLALLCLFGVSVQALAADAGPSDPTTTPAKKFAPRIALAPTISETRVMRMPDGSLVMSCEDRPNPKATALIQRARSSHAKTDQQP